MDPETSELLNITRQTRPRRFRLFLRNYGVDYLMLALLGAASLAMFFVPPAPSRLFPLGDPSDAFFLAEYSYPRRTEIFSTGLTGAIAFSTAFFAILFMQIWVRSKKDFHHAFLGLLISLVGASWFQVTCKWLIGGIRPNFLSICKPDLTKLHGGQGFGGIYYDRSICTGEEWEINEAFQSFPSGHSSAAFAGFLFLSFYLNAKLKMTCTPHRGAFWKIVVVTTPVLMATLISLSRLIDYSHQWYDIIFGALIGIGFAFLGYSTQFYSIFNPLNNHIPTKKESAPFSWKMALPEKPYYAIFPDSGVGSF